MFNGSKCTCCSQLCCREAKNLTQRRKDAENAKKNDFMMHFDSDFMQGVLGFSRNPPDVIWCNTLRYCTLRTLRPLRLRAFALKRVCRSKTEYRRQSCLLPGQLLVLACLRPGPGPVPVHSYRRKNVRQASAFRWQRFP